MKKAPRLIVVLIIIVAMAALVVKRKHQIKNAPAFGMHPLPVRVITPSVTDLQDTRGYLGTVEPYQTAAVASRISARIASIPLDEGDTVKQGDLLLQLDDSDIRAGIKAVESNIQSLETNLAFWASEDLRDSKLAKDGVIPAVEAQVTHNRMSEAAAKLSTARGELGKLNTQLEYTRLTAPFDGIITARRVDPGDLAAPGKVLMTVEDRSSLKIAFDAPQPDLSFLKVGLPVELEINGKPLRLNITHIYPTLNKARMVRVEIKAEPSSQLTSGAFVPLAVVKTQIRKTAALPDSCIMKSPEGQSVVFTVKDGRLHLNQVEVGMRGNNGLISVKGISPTDKVVTSTFLGWANLAEGLKVEVAK